MQVAGEIMLEEVNKKADLLPGYRLRILWQDGLCSAKRAQAVFLNNLFKGQYEALAQGIPLEKLNRDNVGSISTDDASAFTEIWTVQNMSGGPVGLLGDGCSGATMALARLAYAAQFPIVSGPASLPGLSDRKEFPNFYRTVLPDTKFPVVWMTVAKMLGFSKITPVTGDTESWQSMAEVVVNAASETDTQLGGADLSISLVPGFFGYQISLDSSAAANAAAEGLRQQKNRVVLGLIYAGRLRLLLCECHKLGLDNFIFMFYGWLSVGWWKVHDTDCRPKDVGRLAMGSISANAQFWRSDLQTRLSCSADMTAAGFQAKWLQVQGATLKTLGDMTDEGYFPFTESTAVAEAVCMYAQMLHAMLFLHNFTVEDMQQRKLSSYNKMVELFAATDFQGVSGRVQFKPGAADPEGSILIQHVQSFTEDFVDIASYQADGTIFFLGLANLTFKFPGESYFAGPEGATNVNAHPASFQDCPSGTSLNFVNNTCEPCQDKQVFVSSLGVCACRAGHVVSGSGCIQCPEGTFSATVGSTSCESCSIGRFSDATQATTCQRCPKGQYQNNTGKSACLPCPKSFTTNGIGGESAEDCTCGAGTMMSTEGSCVDCASLTEGLECLGGNKVAEGVWISPGYYAEDSALSVFRCFSGKDKCIGGIPGRVCATGRQDLACWNCLPGMKENDDGTCQPCNEGGSGQAAFVGVCVAGLLALFMLYFVVERNEFSSKSHTVLLCALVLSMVITTSQQLGIVSMFKDVDWPEPMASMMKAITLITFDLQLLNLNCIASMSDVSIFIMKVLTGCISVVGLLLLHSIKVVLFHECRFRQRNHILVGSIGTIFLIFYISAISTVVGPLQCVQHPNGKWTVSAYPAVICWETKDHQTMVACGMLGLLIPLAYLAKCTQIVCKFKTMMARGDIDFLKTYYFLFFRYNADAYWYSLVHIFRSLLLANLPIIPNVFAQVTSMQAVLVSQFGIVLSYKPWRVPRTNLLDLFFTVIMLFILGCSAFYTDQQPGEVVAWMIVIVLLFCILLIPITCLIALASIIARQRGKEFQFFICHHKGGAGCFARLLKMQLQKTRGVTRGVFLDCDHLTNLDVLFDYVANMTQTLIVVCSRELFLRPWCLGEVTTAMVKGVNAIRIQLPDYEEPSDDFIMSYSQIVDDLSMLTNRGLTLEQALEAMSWSNTLQKVDMDVNLDDDSLRTLTSQLVVDPSGHRSVSARTMSSRRHSPEAKSKDCNTYILRDDCNLEATAAAMVLCSLLKKHFVHNPQDIPQILEPGKEFPVTAKKAILLCTAGALEQENVLIKLNLAFLGSAKLLPVVVDSSFRYPTTSFEEDHLVLAESACGALNTGEELLERIVRVFKTIAISFPAGSSSEADLRAKASDIAKRLERLPEQANSPSASATLFRSDSPGPAWMQRWDSQKKSTWGKRVRVISPPRSDSNEESYMSGGGEHGQEHCASPCRDCI